MQFEDFTVRAGSRYQYRLVVRDNLGDEGLVESWVNIPGAAAPAVPTLDLTAANPLNDRVGIRYGVPAAESFRLDVFDVRGARIATLANSTAPPGWHEMTWSGRDARGQAIASGIYFLRLETRSASVVRKLVVTR
jgi:hypothetical protein